MEKSDSVSDGQEEMQDAKLHCKQIPMDLWEKVES